jgi:FAD/FMN-containing dehydrogenase
MTTDQTATARELGKALSGDVVLPDDESWEAARQSWNLAVDQRPVAVVLPESVEDVVATVRFARGHGLRIAFNAGGHNAGPIDWSSDALLLKMERMRRLEIDVEGRRARAEGGVLANPVAHAAGEHGLAYLAGTSPDVGIVGYTLGGGFNWMVRKHGLAANSVLAVELVTADGRLVRADAEHEQDLFWAARGGGGNFGAVTAIEFALYPIEEVYAGAFFWPIERAREILNTWRTWVDTVPQECESIGRLLQLPDAPFLPDHLRGRSFALVEVAFLGSESVGEALMRPFRDLEPELDNVTMMPARDLSLVNMDPDFPLPYAGDGILLDEYPPAATDALVESFVGSPLLHAEVRHLGGALRDGSPDHGCLDTIDEPFLFFTFGFAGDPAMHAAVEHHVELVLSGLEPWNSGRRYLNFTESRADPKTMFSEASWDRLQQVKATYDPGALFLANHSIPPAEHPHRSQGVGIRRPADSRATAPNGPR